MSEEFREVCERCGQKCYFTMKVKGMRVCYTCKTILEYPEEESYSKKEPREENGYSNAEERHSDLRKGVGSMSSHCQV